MGRGLAPPAAGRGRQGPADQARAPCRSGAEARDLRKKEPLTLLPRHGRLQAVGG